MTIKEIGWISGLFEGEGWVILPSTIQNIGLGIKSSDKDTMEKVAALWKRALIPDKLRMDRKPTWTVCIYGDAAVEWAYTMYEMLSRRRRARIRDMISRWINRTKRSFRMPAILRSGKPETIARSYQILEGRQRGLTFYAIAKQIGVSKQRAHQIYQQMCA